MLGFGPISAGAVSDPSFATPVPPPVLYGRSAAPDVESGKSPVPLAGAAYGFEPKATQSPPAADGTRSQPSLTGKV